MDMLRGIGKLIGWTAAVLPGWLFLATGLGIVGTTLLIPVRIDLDHLRGRLDLMREQADRMSLQQASYEQFHGAVQTDDPIVLRRLAFHYLHLKPAGSTPMVAPEPLPPISTVEAMLHHSLPQLQDGDQQAKPSRLVRLTTGPHRILLMASGLLFVCAGLTMTPMDESASPTVSS